MGVAHMGRDASADDCCQAVIEASIRTTLDDFSEGQADGELVYLTAFEVGRALADHWGRPEHKAA